MLANGTYIESNVTDIKPTQKADVAVRAKVMPQILMSSCLSQRQVQNLITKDLHHKRELPLHVAVGLTIHHCIRSSRLVQLFHELGFSIQYNRALRLETQIAASVLHKM